VRSYWYSPTAVKRLAELHPTDEELEAIDSEAKMLAKTPKTGFLLPFDNPRELRRYDVGRFGLIYRFDDKRLDIVVVIGA